MLTTALVDILVSAVSYMLGSKKLENIIFADKVDDKFSSKHMKREEEREMEEHRRKKSLQERLVCHNKSIGNLFCGKLLSK